MAYAVCTTCTLEQPNEKLCNVHDSFYEPSCQLYSFFSENRQFSHFEGYMAYAVCTTCTLEQPNEKLCNVHDSYYTT